MMITTMRNRLIELGRQIREMLHLTAHRSFYGLIAVFMGAPIAFLAFLAMNADNMGTSILSIIQSNPATAILTISALLDFMEGYSLWMLRNEVLKSARNYRAVMTILSLQQIMVGNLVGVGISALSLTLSGSLTKQNAPVAASLKTVMALFSVFYVGCLLLTLKIAF